MNTNRFHANKRVTADAVIYDLEGDLTNPSEELLLGLCDWENGLEDGKRYLILNMTRVTYINSIGIAVLIRIVRSLLKSGCLAFAYGVTPHYQKLFRMVGLTERMPIYPNELTILQRLETLTE